MSIRNGSTIESKKYEGYTHFAEHMMFGATEKWSQEEMDEKRRRFLNGFRATTGKREVNILGYFSLQDFDGVMEILRQMIFEWKCARKDFQAEKKLLLDEIKTYNKSYRGTMRTEGYRLLPGSKSRTLGDLEKMKKITFKDVEKIKKYWQELLEKSEIDISFFTDKLEKKQLVAAENIFGSKKGIVERAAKPEERGGERKWEILGSGRMESRKCLGWWIKSKLISLNFLLLDRIFYWRWYDGEQYRFDNCFLQTKDISAFYVFCHGFKSKTLAHEFLFKPISRQEFEMSKGMFLRFFEQCLDMADVQESLSWLEGFWCDRYVELKNDGPMKAYEYFKKLKFEDFKKFLDGLPKMAVHSKNKNNA